MLGEGYNNIYTSVPCWETEAEQRTLARYVEIMPADGRVVEVGSEYGGSASIFCKFAPATAEIVSIDLFPTPILHAHKSNLAEAGFAGRSKQIVSDSKKVKWKTADTIDVLFIDGDHSYEGALHDLNHFTKYVPVGGVLLVHDVAQATNAMPHVMHYQVARALSEWFFAQAGAWDCVEMVDSMWVGRRLK